MHAAAVSGLLDAPLPKTTVPCFAALVALRILLNARRGTRHRDINEHIKPRAPTPAGSARSTVASRPVPRNRQTGHCRRCEHDKHHHSHGRPSRWRNSEKYLQSMLPRKILPPGLRVAQFRSSVSAWKTFAPKRYEPHRVRQTTHVILSRVLRKYRRRNARALRGKPGGDRQVFGCEK